MNRRDFLTTAGGATGGVAALSAASPAAAQENESDGSGGQAGPPDYGSWFGNVGNYDGSTVDARGQDEVTITVGAEGNGGAFAFDPPAVHVDPGTTLLFEWTGDGGGHNVVGEGNDLDSGSLVSEAGVHYEASFDEDGIYKYFCSPHQGQGMKGAIVVGSDYPTKEVSAGGSTPVDPKHMGVPFQAHFVGISTVLAIFVSLVFTFYALKYSESSNIQGGNN
jgi:halocyanin-like protein